MTTDAHNGTANVAEIRIWEVSDCKWSAGDGDGDGDGVAILAAKMAHTGLREDEATFDGQYPNLADYLHVPYLSRAIRLGASLQLLPVQPKTMHRHDTLRLNATKIANNQRNRHTHCRVPCTQFGFGFGAIAMLVTALQEFEHSDCSDQRSTRNPV